MCTLSFNVGLFICPKICFSSLPLRIVLLPIDLWSPRALYLAREPGRHTCVPLFVLQFCKSPRFYGHGHEK